MLAWFVFVVVPLTFLFGTFYIVDMRKSARAPTYDPRDDFRRTTPRIWGSKPIAPL